MSLMRISARAALAAGIFMTLGAAPPGPQTPASDSAGRCSAIAETSFGEDVRVISADYAGQTDPSQFGVPADWRVSSPIPSHCLIRGVINEREGAGGETYGIHFAIALPDDWHGRFLLQGGGGLNGTVHPPLGPVASDGRPALTRGFAVISHDSGHTGDVFDASFTADQRATLDFAEASVRTVALLGKEITAAYYGTQAEHSYMTGCSTGGREGMLASQRYPELFDGIIVGAPAMRTGDSNIGVRYTHTLLNQLAPKNESGEPEIGRLLTAKVRDTLLGGILAQCDALDGLEDGMVENVAQCDFRPDKLVCAGSEGESCISAELASALSRGFAGPNDTAGYPIYVPVPFDTGIVALRGGYLPNGMPGPLGPPNLATSIDLEKEIREVRANPWQRLTDTDHWTNLNTFLDRGGKMLFFHGVSDFWFSPWATWEYYERAAQANGTAFTDASRFYMVPGMMHCRGGNAFDQFDLLSALVDWVERDKLPEEIVAHRADSRSETRPLCPYPSYASYVGGDPAKADSFACKEPAKSGV